MDEALNPNLVFLFENITGRIAPLQLLQMTNHKVPAQMAFAL